MLAALYIVRADVSITVRQSALQVWKAVVANTPRVLLEIIAVLVEQLIAKLASPLEDLRVVAGRSLGELVRKLGDRVLPKVVPHLRAQLRQAEGDDGEDAEAMKQGVCLGLVEILGAASKSQEEAYIGTLVRDSLEYLESGCVETEAAMSWCSVLVNIVMTIARSKMHFWC